jgi:NAD(P)-dependent dehydrogenase (short-subunit alcohol dehydrogenase family)
MIETYLITGANRGIGLEMTRAALRAGHRVIAVCRNPAGAATLGQLQSDHGARCQVTAADVCDAAALAGIAANIEGAVDVVVCNAGAMSARGGIDDLGNTVDAIATVLMTNMVGPFFTARAFLEPLRRSVKPRIAIISSLMGSQQHTAGAAHFYRASKAGANNLMVTLSNELKVQNIAVAAYHPGWVQTDMGGPGADLTPAESAVALMARFRALDLSQTGGFFNYDGAPLPL